jgi:hypothetical protein
MCLTTVRYLLQCCTGTQTVHEMGQQGDDYHELDDTANATIHSSIVASDSSSSSSNRGREGWPEVKLAAHWARPAGPRGIYMYSKVTYHNTCFTFTAVTVDTSPNNCVITGSTMPYWHARPASAIGINAVLMFRYCNRSVLVGMLRQAPRCS